MKKFLNEIEKYYLRYEDFNDKIISINKKIRSLEEKRKEIDEELAALKSKQNSLIHSRNEDIRGNFLVVVGNHFHSLKRKRAKRNNQEEE